MVQTVHARDRRVAFCFILILLVQTFFMTYIGSLKQGFHLDEIYSFADSNSFYKPRVQDYNVADSWLDSNIVHEMLTVSPEYRFRYDSAYVSQNGNNHPPLYYLFLHSVCSLFPDTFSIWYATSLNILFFIVTGIFIYLISQKIISNQWSALFPVIFFGFSTAAASMLNFLRMYYLMTAIGMAFLYVQLRMLESEPTKKNLTANMLVIFLGGFTHYYFFIFAFFMCAFMGIRYLLRRAYKTAIRYGVSSGLGVFLSICAFPRMVLQMFFRDRGRQAVEKIQTADGWLSEIKQMLDVMNEGLFANQFLWIFLFVCAALLCAMLIFFKSLEKKKSLRTAVKEKLGDVRFQFILFTVMTTGLYIVFISHIVPYYSDRYIMNLYPIIPIICFYLAGCIRISKRHIPICSIAVLIVCLCLNANELANHKMGYLYEGETDKKAIMEEYSAYTCVIASKQKQRIHERLLDIPYYREVYYLLNKKDLSRICEIIEGHENVDKGFVLYLDRDYDRDQVLEYIYSAGVYTTEKMLFTSAYYNVYYIN